MQPLTGMDATFLYLETPTAHMHVVGTIVLDAPDGDGSDWFASARELIRSRLPRLAPFRRRLREVPLSLGHPVWIEDPHFVLDNHLHRIAVPSPGSPRELADIVAHIASIPLDRGRPLWDLWAVEGLEGGGVALIIKMHHAALDGVGGTDLLLQLFDMEAGAPLVAAPDTGWSGEREPSATEMVSRALSQGLRQPARFARVALGTLRSAANLALSVVRSADTTPGHAALPFTAPRTAFSGSISPRRAVAFARADLAELKAIKNAFEATVNDVVLAVCTLALRRYLLAHHDLPDRPLIATVPVSVRTEQERGEFGNRVASMFVHLPVHLDDPAAVVQAIRSDTKDAKKVQRAFGANIISDWAQLAPAGLFPRAALLYSAMRLADHHRPVHNLVISNVPGPEFPLYVAGCRVRATYPFGPVLEGAGLNITVMSYQGGVDFGVIACQESVADLWDLARGFESAVTELEHAAALRTPAESHPLRAQAPASEAEHGS